MTLIIVRNMDIGTERFNVKLMQNQFDSTDFRDIVIPFGKNMDEINKYLNDIGEITNAYISSYKKKLYITVFCHIVSETEKHPFDLDGLTSKE